MRRSAYGGPLHGLSHANELQTRCVWEANARSARLSHVCVPSASPPMLCFQPACGRSTGRRLRFADVTRAVWFVYKNTTQLIEADEPRVTHIPESRREKPHLIHIQKLDAMTNEEQCTKIGVSKFQFLGYPDAFQLNGRTTFFVLRLFSGREVLDPTLLRCVLGFPLSSMLFLRHCAQPQAP